MSRVQPIILCGGSGTRLWPLSSLTRPKQFVEIADKGTLLDLTIERVNLISIQCRKLGITCHDPILIMHASNKGSHNYSNVIYEEYANDTAVAVAHACLCVKDNDIMLVLPADHYIENINAFIDDITTGIANVTTDNIVLYGIQPTFPETKYGYIIPESDKVSFIEKPNADIAQDLINNRNALWNSGIFASRMCTVYSCLQDLIPWLTHPRPGKAPSFDVAVLQEYPNIHAHYCTDWKWSDVGTWEAFTQIPEIKEEINNQDGVITKNCNNVNVLNHNMSNVIIIGCENLLVVTSGTDILIMPNKGDYNNELKDIVSNMSQ